MANCNICSHPAEPAYSITYINCPCTSHADCVGQDIDVDKCVNCLAGKPVVETVAVISEPHTEDGIDYVSKPGTKGKSVLSKIASIIPGVRKAAPAQPVWTPEQLLKKRVPIDVIMTKHGYGLDHMLRDGITIDDFIINGYKWSDLTKFEYISKEGQFKALKTFVDGLKLNANHLKNHPNVFPIEQFKEVTGISNAQYRSLLGMKIPRNNPLQCDNDISWNAKDCVRLGIEMSDLIDWGMYCSAQFNDLMDGLTKNEQEQAMVDLNVTEEHLAQLADFDKKHETSTANVAAAVVAVESDDDDSSSSYVSEEIVKPKAKAAAVAKPKAKPIVVVDSDSDSDSSVEPIAAPVPAPAPARRKKVRTPKPKATPVARADVHIPPSYVYASKKKLMQKTKT